MYLIDENHRYELDSNCAIISLCILLHGLSLPAHSAACKEHPNALACYRIPPYFQRVTFWRSWMTWKTSLPPSLRACHTMVLDLARVPEFRTGDSGIHKPRVPLAIASQLQRIVFDSFLVYATVASVAPLTDGELVPFLGDGKVQVQALSPTLNSGAFRKTSGACSQMHRLCHFELTTDLCPCACSYCVIHIT